MDKMIGEVELVQSHAIEKFKKINEKASKLSEMKIALIDSTKEEIQKLMQTPIYRHKGCNKCDFTGYVGRLGVYEIMAINKEIKKLVASGAHDIEIEEAAVRNGMRTLNQSCMAHIINGRTTIDEFVRVLGVVNE